MGEESKVRVKTMHQHRPNPCQPQPRHTGFKAGQQQDKTTDRIPLSLDGRGIKGEGETRQSHHRVIPSKARNLKTPPHMNLRPVILALRQYPQGGDTPRVIPAISTVIADLIRNPEG